MSKVRCPDCEAEIDEVTTVNWYQRKNGSQIFNEEIKCPICLTKSQLRVVS